MSGKMVPCVICGKLFTRENGNGKYCSRKCSEIGSKAKRKEWELRTGYREKKRIEAQKRRDATKAAAKADREAAAQQRAEDFNRWKAERKEQHPENELSRLASIAEMNGNSSPEYWEAFKEYDLKYAADSGRISRMEVNGIPVSEPDFGLLVCETIAAGGRIIARARRERKPC